MTYRKGVGLVLFNAEKKIWAGLRFDQSAAWQMPQGGVDESEVPFCALKREVNEEIGLDIQKVEILSTTPWLRYDFPEEIQSVAYGGLYRGQEQKWFLGFFKGKDEDVHIHGPHPEFSSWMWQESAFLEEHIVSFKKDLYGAIFQSFSPLIHAYIV